MAAAAEHSRYPDKHVHSKVGHGNFGSKLFLLQQASYSNCHAATWRAHLVMIQPMLQTSLLLCEHSLVERLRHKMSQCSLAQSSVGLSKEQKHPRTSNREKLAQLIGFSSFKAKAKLRSKTKPGPWSKNPRSPGSPSPQGARASNAAIRSRDSADPVVDA